jgi:L-amino acid N-acyltransferase YncA
MATAAHWSGVGELPDTPQVSPSSKMRDSRQRRGAHSCKPILGCVRSGHLVLGAAFMEIHLNVDVDVELMTNALKLSGLPTQKAVIEEGLRQLIRLCNQTGVREMFGKIPLDNDLD